VIKFAPPVHKRSAQHDKPQVSPLESMDHMTSSELRAMIIELRPPNVSDLVERDHEVLAARHARDSLLALLRQAQLKCARVDRQLDHWRSTHPVQTGLYELGLLPFGFPDKHKTIKEMAEREARNLAEQVEQAREHARNVERSVEARIAREQAPLREHIAELERLERQKTLQELAERWQIHEFDNAMTVFKMLALKREMKVLGHDDAGPQWKTLPDSLRKAIDNFNQLPKEARAIALERMRSSVKLDEKDARRLMREMGLDWE
jgi:hypothetical protein